MIPNKMPSPLSRPGEKPQPAAAPAAPPAVDPKPTQQTPEISPEMVCFRSADEVCGGCAHWGADGNCAVLSMVTGEQDSCNAFTGGGGAQEEIAEGEAQ